MGAEFVDRTSNTAHVLVEVEGERIAQERKWGQQNLPDGTSPKGYGQLAQWAKEACDEAAKNGTCTWLHVLREEFYEALAESDPQKLRGELIQVAAVATSWVEAIDRRPVPS